MSSSSTHLHGWSCCFCVFCWFALSYASGGLGGGCKDVPPLGGQEAESRGEGLPHRVMKRMRMVATWARLASPWGSRVPASVPVHRPVSTAQAMALWA